MECFFKYAEALQCKNIGLIYECHGVNYVFSSLNDLYVIVKEIVSNMENELGIEIAHINFYANEPIGDHYIIYKFHLLPKKINSTYCSCRLITYRNKVKLIICTIGNTILKYLSPAKISAILKKNTYHPKLLKTFKVSTKEIPKGQRIIPNFIIYRILGQPHIDLGVWKLKVKGIVKKSLELTYSEILSMPMRTIISDFHCVTGWSVRRVKWEGVPLRYLALKAEVLPKAKWVYVSSLDGYTTIIPLEDFISKDSLLVLRMNDKVLSLEQGFPARIFIPHLYGWKGAKWVETIIFTDHYANGYWETLGYHERGNVWNEERFKQ